MALILTAQIRTTLTEAWNRRDEVAKEDRLSRRYSLRRLMLRLGPHRKIRFTGTYGEVVSTPTKAQRSIFIVLGVEIS